jgi:hypothetical protein
LFRAKLWDDPFRLVIASRYQSFQWNILAPVTNEALASHSRSDRCEPYAKLHILPRDRLSIRLIVRHGAASIGLRVVRMRLKSVCEWLTSDTRTFQNRFKLDARG